MAQVEYNAHLSLNGNQLLNAAQESLATAPTSPVTGRTYFNTASSKFYGWNGTAWTELAGSAATAATTVASGTVRLATAAESLSGTAVDTAVSPATLASTLASTLSASYPKAYRTTLATLPAATATTVTHGLNAASVSVTTFQGGVEVKLAVATVSTSAFTLTSNTALSSVSVLVIG